MLKISPRINEEKEDTHLLNNEMSEDSPIKDALYEKIKNIGEKQIHQLLLNGNFSELFERICEPVIHHIKSIEEYEKYGTIAESVTHYLFTEMLIPSQRKISFKNIELDIIIPNLDELQKNNHNAIVILFAKTPNNIQLKQRIEEIKKIQNVDSNIWIISKDSLNISQSTYIIEKYSFSDFLKDAQNFVKTKKMNKLNIFKT
tara:strand:+ start:9 stop:614 length:606 start_codon:yes stop_codon:yes gene_type:complete